jgi:membrane protein required for colicin V production
MWLNLVAMAILFVFVLLGAWRGALATGLGIATLLLSYAAAILLGPQIAPVLGARLGLGPLAMPLGGTVAFFGTYVVLGLAATAVRKMARSENDGRGPLDRLLGGAFGAVRGLLVAVLLVYLAMWLDALRATGNTAVIPEVGNSAAAVLTSTLLEGAIHAASDSEDPAARVTARLAARPAVAAVELQGVVEDPTFLRLREDSGFWAAVESGNVDAAMNRRTFLMVQQNAQLRQKLANLALVPDEAAQDQEAFREAVGEVLRDVGPKIRDVRNDPALDDLMNDPQVVAMIQDGDTRGLLSHPGIRELVARVTSSSDD